MQIKGIERGEPASLALTVRRAAVIGSMAGLALLVGCVDEPASRFVTAPEATLGDTVEGELTTASAVHLNTGTRYASHWLCGGDVEAPGVLYALETSFAAELSAFDEQGRWLGVAQGGPEGEQASLLVAPAAGGCTLAVISGRDGNAFGPYRLAVDEAASVGDEPLMAGHPRLGRLGGEEQVYPLRVEAPVHLALSLSGGAPVGLQLVGEGVSESARACADGALRLETYLDAGDYRVHLRPGVAPEAAAESCMDSVLSTGGTYRLLAEQRDLADGRRNGGPLRGGDRITGTLESGGPNVYRLHLDEPAEVSLSLRSRDFDTLLRVIGEGTDLSNDDGGQGTDSRLETVLMAGDYEVEVGSYGDEDGDYALSLTREAFSGAFRNDGALAGGESVRGQLGGLGNNRYSFSVEEEAVEVTLALDSTDFDPVLRLQGNGLDISDDDGGGDRNSLITAVLEPGDYTLEVQSYSGTGIYRLSAEQAAFEGRMADGGEVRIGETVYGNLATGGQLSYQLNLEGEEGESRSVTIEATSSSADTVLTLRKDGSAIDENDDADGLGLGSRITRNLASGTYEIEVQSFGGGSGMVRLSIDG